MVNGSEYARPTNSRREPPPIVADYFRGVGIRGPRDGIRHRWPLNRRRGAPPMNPANAYNNSNFHNNSDEPLFYTFKPS